jgi:hypothetical protein
LPARGTANVPAIRDQILHQLTLDRYIPSRDPSAKARDAKYRHVTAGLNPEPFMLALKRADMGVGPWLVDEFPRDCEGFTVNVRDNTEVSVPPQVLDSDGRPIERNGTLSCVTLVGP